MVAVMHSVRRKGSSVTPASGRLLLRAAGRFESPGGAGSDLEPKDALLLAYLALEGPTPRGRLASLLWPEVEEERARGNLRQRLLRLKRATGLELVEGGVRAQLVAGVEHDLDGTHELLQALEPEQAGGLDEWLERQRERRRRDRAEEVAAQAAQAEGRGDLAVALEHAHAGIDLEPVSEEAHRRVMRLHYLAGDAAAALAAYDRCVLALRSELGVAPGAETKRLRSQIEQAVPPASVPVRGIPVTVLRPPRLIGRDAEWAALQAAWTARDAAFVLGEAGLGKTRLLSDFARAHPGVVTVSARPGDERVVYAVATRVLRQVPRERLDALDAAVRRELARLLPELGEAEPIRSEAERSRFYNAIGAVLQVAGGGIAGVVVDDLHFADDASVELIQYLVGDRQAGWAFAGRPAELGTAARALLEALRTASPAAVIELAPLTQSQLQELVASLGIDGFDAAERAAVLLRQTGGNPLFALEVIKGWLTQQDVGTDARLPAVPGVGALIARRIGHLSQDAVRLARCAAIAGQDFSAELAAHVLGVRPLDLADAWTELETAQVFKDGAFAHDLIHEAARASVPGPIARQLHREVAAYLTGCDAPPGRLAAHWLAAGRQREALAALMSAAESARRQTLRLAEATRLYESAAEVAEQLGDQQATFDALRALVEAWILLDRNRLDDAIIARLESHAKTPHQQAQALRLHGHILGLCGRYPDSIAVAQRAADLARAAGDELLAVEATSDAAAAASQIGDAQRAVRLLRPLLPWTLEHGSDEVQINVLGHLAVSLDNIDHQTEAQSMHRRAIQAAMRARNFDQAVSAWGNLSISLIDVGKPRAAREAIAQARNVGTAYDALAGTSFPLNLFDGAAATALRRYREALAALDAALADLGFHRLGAASVRLHRACLWIHLGQFARAQRELAVSRSEPPEPEWLQARREQLLGRLAWWTGRQADAANHWRKAMDHAPTKERAVLAAMIALDHAQAQPADAAAAIARDVLATAERLDHFGSALAARIRLAGFHLLQADVEAALETLAEVEKAPPDVEPNDMYGGERWLVAVRVLTAAGRMEDAHRVLGGAVESIRRTAKDHIPPEFQDAFLRRNPVNRELLALAVRLT